MTRFSAFNLTESVPSIHTGPQAFKDMINPTKKSDDQKTADHYQLEMLRRVRQNMKSDWLTCIEVQFDWSRAPSSRNHYESL